MFTHFSDIALEALPNNSEFIAQSERMIESFGRLLDALGNEDRLMTVLEPIGVHLYGIGVTSNMIEVDSHSLLFLPSANALYLLRNIFK